MLVNELTFYELKRIITPAIQLQPMSRVLSGIGEVLGISNPTRQKIQKQEQFLLSYKGFDVFFYELRWLRDRGPCMSLQFKRAATEWQKRPLVTVWFRESLMDKVCGEVIQDLKSICLEEIPEVKLTSTDIDSPGWAERWEVRSRVTYPQGAFNNHWKQGLDISPLMIVEEYNSAGGNWFVSWTFNPGAFIRKDGKTILRENWREYANDISKSINAEVTRYCFSDHAGPKAFEECLKR